MEQLLSLLVIVILIEAIWEWLKGAGPRGLVRLEKEKFIPVDRLGVLLLAVAFVFAAGLDLLAAAGAELSFLGILFTAILAARLANLWHDLLGVADGMRRDKRPLEKDSGLF